MGRRLRREWPNRNGLTGAGQRATTKKEGGGGLCCEVRRERKGVREEQKAKDWGGVGGGGCTYIAELGDGNLAADVLEVVDVVVELVEPVPLLNKPLVMSRERLEVKICRAE
jgi:hypothetical protein